MKSVRTILATGLFLFAFTGIAQAMEQCTPYNGLDPEKNEATNLVIKSPSKGVLQDSFKERDEEAPSRRITTVQTYKTNEGFYSGLENQIRLYNVEPVNTNEPIMVEQRYVKSGTYRSTLDEEWQENCYQPWLNFGEVTVP